jgi:hypothetical protein
MPLQNPDRKTPARGRVRIRLVTLGAAMALAVGVGVAGPVTAAAARAAAPNALDEGGTAELRQQLDAASRGYLDAKAALAKSVERQKALTARLSTLENELATRTAAVHDLAKAAYRTGRLGPVSALLNSESPDAFVDRATTLGAVVANENRELRKLAETRDREARTKAALDQEVREQRKQVAVMANRKKQAEQALAAANARAEAAARNNNGSGSTTGGSSGGAASAKPAPRNPDGSWPRESCSVKDPTTSGCLTPRTLHALNQAKAAGFTRYVACFRNGGSGEHPKGRACDFAAQKGGFGGVATGGDRTYGDNLANYYIRNADRLGVLYVIWFKRIWLPSSGWQVYYGGGDPSSDHTNHVHLSMY